MSGGPAHAGKRRVTTSIRAREGGWNMKNHLQFAALPPRGDSVAPPSAHITTTLFALLLIAEISPLPAAADQTNSTPFALDQQVRSIALQPDGKVLIGGEFTVADGATRGHVARLNSDGSTDFTFMNGLAGANGNVYSTALQP